MRALLVRWTSLVVWGAAALAACQNGSLQSGASATGTASGGSVGGATAAAASTGSGSGASAGAASSGGRETTGAAASSGGAAGATAGGSGSASSTGSSAGAASSGSSGGSSGGTSFAGSPQVCQNGACWRPALQTRWYYQLSSASSPYTQTGGVNVGATAVPYTGGATAAPLALDFDLYDLNTGNTVNTAAVLAVHAAGAFAICYVDAGTYENFRPDISSFPPSVLGADNGWPGEQWLDIRQTAILLPIMQARLAKCVAGGFDAVEWDNVDGYENTTGFPLTAQDQLSYDEQLANMAHQSGLAVALKNDTDQVATLEPYFDLSIDEECQYYSECDTLDPFLAAGKPVLQVEYTSDDMTTPMFCPEANGNSPPRNAILCDLNLTDATWIPCE